MRQLTDREREAREQAWIKHINDRGLNSNPIDFEAGLFAGLDYQQAQIAALTAERDALREALKPFAEYAATLTNWDSDPVVVAKWSGILVTVGDFRKAAAVRDNQT